MPLGALPSLGTLPLLSTEMGNSTSTLSDALSSVGAAVPQSVASSVVSSVASKAVSSLLSPSVIAVVLGILFLGFGLLSIGKVQQVVGAAATAA